MASQRKQVAQAPALQGLVPSDTVEHSWDESADDGLACAEVEHRELTVGSEHHGQRVDKVLALGVSEFSRSYLQQLLADGAVTLNGKVLLKSSVKVAVADRLRVEMRPTQQSMAFQPEAMDLQVVYEDEDLLVINKPAGLVVHPAPGNWTGTLLNGLLARDEKARQVPRAGIVHRLDKDTSGLMVVARNRSTMDALIKMIAAREVSRQYLALAHHPWGSRKHREVDAPIGRDPRNRLRMAVVDLNLHPGKQARTDFDLLDGDAISGSVARHSIEMEGGGFYRGFGLRLNGTYTGGSRIDASGLPGSSTLRFDPIATFNLRMFADLGRKEKLVEKVPFFKGSRLSLSVSNLFNAQQRVTDDTGTVPLRYQPGYLDARGRVFEIEFRKQF